eukprot:jgi/Chrzof1/6644/Cz19g04040.t1
MRFMSFVTNLGRKAEWGFANVTNATTATVYAPRPYSYIAAIRGEEGKPLPKHLGGWKKRYIVRISFVWAALQGCHDVRVNGTVTLTSNNATTNTSASPAVNLAAAPPPLAVAPSNVTAATRKEAAQVSSQSVSSTPQVGRCGVAKLCFQLLQCH